MMNDARYAAIRQFTSRLINDMDEGLIDPRTVADMALAYMSEDQVKDMCLSNDILDDEDDTDEDASDPMDDVNYVGHPCHY